MDSQLLAHPDVRIFLGAFFLLVGIYVSVMYTCWGTLSLSKVRSGRLRIQSNISETNCRLDPRKVTETPGAKHLCTIS